MTVADDIGLPTHIQKRLNHLEAIQEARGQIHYLKKNHHKVNLAEWNREYIDNLLNLISKGIKEKI